MPDDLQIRPLRDGEQEALLELLDGWPFKDGRRGSEFFRRYLELDHTFESRNVWIAEREGELVSCVHVFPRTVRLSGHDVPAGGIGSVFTREGDRGSGVASEVLAAATRDMTARGMELSLLWANRVSWYQAMGWEPWGGEQVELVWDDRANAGFSNSQRLRLEVVRFAADEHLERVKRLARSYNAHRDGTVVRDDESWASSLRLAGNPVEEFVLAQGPGDGEPVAFLRGCFLSGTWVALEWARDMDAAAVLAELMATTLNALGVDKIRMPMPADPLLEAELDRLGLRMLPVMPGKEALSVWMLRCLAPEALANRLGVEVPEGSPAEQLAALFPKNRFHFWAADRF